MNIEATVSRVCRSPDSRVLALASVVVMALACGDLAPQTIATPVGPGQTPAVGAAKPPAQAPAGAETSNDVPRAADLESLVVEAPPDPPAPVAEPPAVDAQPAPAEPDSAPQPQPEPATPEASSDAPDFGGIDFGGGFGTPTPATDSEAGDPMGSGPAVPPTVDADDCTPLSIGMASGDIGTEAACFIVPEGVMGWQVSNLGTRTLTVNGETASPPSLPAPETVGYTFSFSAGDPEYTAFSTW